MTTDLTPNISNDFSQQFEFVTEANQTFSFSLNYLEGQQQWFYSLQYNNFQINNQRLVIDPNFLRRFKGMLPFGISCFAAGADVDPFLLNDFVSGRIQLLLLTQAEVNTLETELYGV